MLIDAIGAVRFGGNGASPSTGDLAGTLHSLFTADPAQGRDLMRLAITSGDPAQLVAVRNAATQLGTLGNGIDVAAEFDGVMARHGAPIQREAHAAAPQSQTVSVKINDTVFGSKGQSWESWKREKPAEFQKLIKQYGSEEAAIRAINQRIRQSQAPALDKIAGGHAGIAAKLDGLDTGAAQQLIDQFSKLPPAEKQAYRALAEKAGSEGTPEALSRFELEAAAMLFDGLPSASVANSTTAQLASRVMPLTSRLATMGARTPINAAALAVGASLAAATWRPVDSPLTAHPNGGTLETFPDQSDDAARYGQIPPSVAHTPENPILYTPAEPILTPPLITSIPEPILPPVEGFPAQGPETPLVLENRSHKADGDVAAAPKGSANPATRAAAGRGSTLHSDKPGMLPDQLRARYPNTEFEFTKPGVRGQDVHVAKGDHPSTYDKSSWPQGVDYGDFKPATAGGAKTFRHDQANKWSEPTHYLPYDPATGKLLPH